MENTLNERILMYRYNCINCHTSVEKPFRWSRLKCPVCGRIMYFQYQILRENPALKGGDKECPNKT
jgi:DNA-directed RNA polymerase subunit RPC12/RpoP